MSPTATSSSGGKTGSMPSLLIVAFHCSITCVSPDSGPSQSVDMTEAITNMPTVAMMPQTTRQCFLGGCGSVKLMMTSKNREI